MIPANYQCEGQLNLWDYFKEEPIEEPEEADDEFTPCWDPSELNNEFPPVDPDVASGKKKPYEYDFERHVNQRVYVYGLDGVEKQVGIITAFDDYYTEVKCGWEDYACTNLNVGPIELPDIEEAIRQIEKSFGIKLQGNPCDWDESIGTEWSYKKGKAVLEIHESHYFGDNERFISVSWQSTKEGMSGPCDCMEEVFQMVEKGLEKKWS